METSSLWPAMDLVGCMHCLLLLEVEVQVPSLLPQEVPLLLPLLLPQVDMPSLLPPDWMLLKLAVIEL